MSSHEIVEPRVDPTIAEADRRVERAKASLLARVEVLKHKLGDARAKLDLHAQIARYPLPAVAIAFALGALAGSRGARRAEPATAAERSLSGAMLTGLAAVGLRMVRELALVQLGQVARRWWAVQDHMAPVDSPASRVAAVEPFFER